MIIPISNVVCADRIRSVNAATVLGLADSILEVGLLNPITVCLTTIVRDGRAQDGYVLIGGLHRLEAAKSLGWNEIEATMTDLSGPAAVIAECDENLCGTNLTAAERALFTRRRKEAYEALHPETAYDARPGRAGKCRQFGDISEPAERFTADTATKTGQSERAVQRDAARGKNIAPEILAEIAGTKLDTGKTLDELASVSKDDQVAKLAELREAKANRLLAEEAAKEVRKATAATDRVILLTEAQQFAEWLMARTDLNEIPMVISWLEGCKSKDVIAAMRREAA